MSKAIRSYPRSQQAMVIKRRRTQAAGGMGYHAAISLKADMIVNGQRTQELEQVVHALDSVRHIAVQLDDLMADAMTQAEFSDTQEPTNA